MKYDISLLKTAFIWADESQCKRLKVGAIIAKESRIISIGFNGTPSGLMDKTKKPDNNCEILLSKCVECDFGFRKLSDLCVIQSDLYTYYNCPNCGKTLAIFEGNKQIYSGFSKKLITNPNVIHAEMNALMFAAKQGISTNGATMYVTHSPCINCAKHIIQAGIKRVVYSEEYRENDGIELLKKMISVKKIPKEKLWANM